MKLLKIKFALLFSSLCFVLNVYSQITPKPPSIIPVSPNASEYAKYSETQLNQSTGANTISIPLFNIEMEEMTLPINLTYSGTAIRVDQAAGSYGLGWVLSSGGIISSSKIDGAGIKALWDMGRQEIVSDKYTNQTLLPYVYNYNFNGYSGQFYYNVNDQIINLGDPRLKIVGARNGYKFITPDGITYHFGENENFEETPSTIREFSNKTGLNSEGRFDLEMILSDYMSLNTDVTIPNLYYNYRDVTPTFSNEVNQWLLRKITFPNSNDSISFHYETLQLIGPPDQYCLIDEYSYIPINQIVNPDKFEYIHRSFTFTRSNDRPCSSIIWPNGKIVFEYQGREDAVVFNIPGNVSETEGEIQYSSGSSSAVAISKMKIYDNNNIFLKGFNFKFKYSNSSSTDPLSKRLLLSGINEYSTNSNLPPYKFNYGFDMPHLLSNAQDFFGYYNGKDLKSLGPALFQHVKIMHKIPYLTYSGPGRPTVEMNSSSLSTYILNLNLNPIDYPSPFLIYRGYGSQSESLPNIYYDRRPTNDMKVGMLESIEYPTGGIDGFEYTIDTAQFYYHGELKSIIGGGLKLSKVYRSYGLGNQPPLEKNYIYEGAKLQYLPYFARSYFDAGDLEYNIVRDVFYGTPINSPKGSNVIFSKVTEVIPNYGKTVFEYDVPAFVGVNSNSNFTIDCNAPELSYLALSGSNYPQYHNVLDYFPFSSSSNYDWANGKLLKQTKYNLAGNIVEQIENEYKEILYGNFNRFEVTILNDVVKKISYNYTGLDLTTDGVFRISKSYLISAWRPIIKSTKKIFDQSSLNNFIIETTNYDYNLENQLVKCEKKSNSDGKKYLTINKYANDYDELGEDIISLGIAGLKEKHMISKLVETSDYIINPSLDTNKYLLTSKLSLFKNIGSKTLPWKVEILNSSSPLINFIPSYNDPYSLEFIKDSRYKTEITFTKYNDSGKLIELQDKNNNYISYKWGYSQKLPIAKTENARTSSNEIGNETSYVGFESRNISNNNPDEDFWTFNLANVNLTSNSFTGKHGLNVKPSASPFMYKTFECSGDLKKNIISGWVKVTQSENYNIQSKDFKIEITDINNNLISTSILKTLPNNNEWKYFNTIFNIPENIGLCTYKVKISNPIDNNNYELTFDDIRVQPINSNMVTYTYNETYDKPTSISDLNNFPTHYDYDDLGRLISVKDHNKDILKTNIYLYTPKNY